MELRDLLEPPFAVDKHHNIQLGEIAYVCIIVDRKKLSRLDGDFARDALNDFVFQALNEKWQRDLGEPMRWARVPGYMYRCPKCGLDNGWRANYCPSCGQRLYPPEGAE